MSRSASREQHGNGLHDHGSPHGVLGWIAAILHLPGHGHSHSHDHGWRTGDSATATAAGIRAVWIALAALLVTAIVQAAIFVASGSVALLADTVHNVGDMLNSIPLLLAFFLARRPPTRRYTYGFGRAEDVAGVIIVLSILFSAAFILWESIVKLFDPQPLTHLPWVAAAAVIGFIGNEAVAVFQITTGKRIGSASLVADGQHARIDGLTSLVVLVAVAGSALGFPIVDPIVGIIIGMAILLIAREATVAVWRRLMDAIDPAITDQIGQYAGEAVGVDAVTRVQARYVGHELHVEIGIRLEDGLTLDDALVAVATIRSLVNRYIRHVTQVSVDVEPSEGYVREIQDIGGSSDILPAQYREPGRAVSAAPMGAVALAYDDLGEVAWGEMWEGFCELALAGGAPHRGTLLEPVHEKAIAAEPERCAWVLGELERGLRQVTGLDVMRGAVPGWIGLECGSEEMAIWMLRAIVVENVTVRREGHVLWFPAGPDFRLDKEIRNVITVAAKTNHYWQDHVAGKAIPR